MSTQQISDVFDWDDEKSYKWIIKAPGNVKLTVVFTLLMLLFIPTIIYSIFHIIGLLVPKVSFYIAFVLFLMWLGYVLLSLFSIFTGNERMKNKSRAYLKSQTFVFIALVAYVVSSPASFLSHGFATESNIATIGVFEWIKYFLDNLFSVIFIGIFDIFDIKLSEITAITNGARAMMFLFNIVFTIGILDAIIAAYQTRKDEEFIGTVQDFYHKCDNLPSRSRFDIKFDGVYSKFEKSIFFNAADFKTLFLKNAEDIYVNEVDEKNKTQEPTDKNS